MPTLEFGYHQYILTESKPWGGYFNLSAEPDHKIKRIYVLPGEKLSLQLHHKRDEHWIFLKGNCELMLGDKTVHAEKNHHYYIPRRTRHRIINNGNDLAIILEIQTGEYFGEDDIVRFQDAYGRV